jgi:hypothetical protein|tara:strand:+ start:40 stop:1503 length:1464 start_codon:yes stop_codon:yes gene_type:complete
MTAQTILPANKLSSGYDVANSLMIEGGDSASLSRTFGTPTNGKKWTFSTWHKSGTLGTRHMFGCGATNQTGAGHSYIGAIPNFYGIYYDGSSTIWNLISQAIHRDPSAWAHYMFVFDSANGTADNRLIQYVNGVRQIYYADSYQDGLRTNPDQNYDTAWNSNITHYIGTRGQGGTGTGGQYFCETAFFDGQAYAPSNLGEFDENSPTMWKPKDFKDDLTFGNNGFYLEYKQTGTSANSSGMGADTSGNDNHFTVTNLTAVDQNTDTCTNNFATFNPLASVIDAPTFTQGNLVIDINNAGKFGAESSIGVTQGKWYAEFKLVASSDNDMAVGVNSDRDMAADDNAVGFGSNSIGYRETGTLAVDGTDDISYGNSYTVNDIVGIALDLDNNKLYFSKNGTFQASGDPTSGATGTGAKALAAASATELGAYFFNAGVHSASQNGDWAANFGSPPYAISSGNTDGNGYGNFEYAPPAGYFALCTKNLNSFG